MQISYLQVVKIEIDPAHVTTELQFNQLDLFHTIIGSSIWHSFNHQQGGWHATIVLATRTCPFVVSLVSTKRMFMDKCKKITPVN